MPESPTPSGPSLEQILWRAMDRFQEEPALLDAEEFAAHIEQAFQAGVPVEAFVDRFFDGPERMHERDHDLADAVVRASSRRLHAYEFDLRQLEYLVIEDKGRLTVVSDFGQFAVQTDDAVVRALDAAVVSRPERSGGQPRAYFVRQGGEVVGLDAKKISRTLEQLFVRQVSLPAVDAPARRLSTFNPVRTVLTETREARALRQDPRLRSVAPAAPPSLPPAVREQSEATKASPPAPGRTALFVLMPDGTLARPEIGAANRWRQMLGRATSLDIPQRITVQTTNVVAVIDRAGSLPGSAAEKALARADALSAVRADSAPVRMLGDDALARAFAEGAKVVPALSRGERYWVQPERAFVPDSVAARTVVAQPLRLGEITGDPWADWALTGGAASAPEALLALRNRRPVLRAALDRGDADPLPPMLASRALAAAPSLQLAGGAVVAFRTPDGNLIVNREAGAIRLASADRPSDVPLEMLLPLPRPEPVAARTGAVPFTALQSLELALERTASAGGYRLPLLRIASAPDALEVGDALRPGAFDERRTAVRLAGPPALIGQTGQLLLSMPFPNRGELHVGGDLADALQTWLTAPVVPAQKSQDELVLRVREPAAVPAGPVSAFDWSGLHAQAARQAQAASVALELPAVRAQPDMSGLPVLLRRALAQGGDWTPGPGAPMPTAVRDFALRTPAFAAQPAVASVPDVRPLRPGEDEIVIPMPLWAQMGRGALSETGSLMASPLAPAGYAPPLGIYRLVIPAGGSADLTGGAPAGTPGAVDVAGPTTVRVVSRAAGAVTAGAPSGRYSIGRVPVDEGEAQPGRRGRIRIGEPLRGEELPVLVAGAPAPPATSAEAAVLPDAGLDVPDALPARPALPQGGQQPGVTAAAAEAFASRTAAPALRSSSTTAQLPDRSADGLPIVTGVPAQRRLQRTNDSLAGAREAAPALDAPAPRAAGKDTAADVRAGKAAARTQVVPAPSRAAASAPPAIEEAQVASLPAGMWSGRRQGSAGVYQRWTWSPRSRDEAQSAGGVDLAGLSRPVYPQLPTSLRFRYVGAPLWWSGSDEAGDGAARSLQGGLRAANSAASIWRSILVAGPAREDLTGGMDNGRDTSADQMSSLSRSLDALAAAQLVATPVTTPAQPLPAGPAYIVMSSSGAGGPVSAAGAARARAQAVEMSIVAAIPPAPPPLESMGSGAGMDQPHARARSGHPVAQGAHKEADDAVSASKIEGSVDAIAQRIYHRIRRRIQSDRERFGG